MKNHFLALAGVLFLQACASTNPGGAADIDYRFPRTDAKVTLSIDVTQCLGDQHQDQVLVDSTLKVDAVAGVQQGYWHVPGAYLSSNVTKRGLVIDVDDNGVISSINSTSTDQSTVILGDAVKLIATTAGGLAAAKDKAVLQCKEKTKRALENLTSLTAKLDAERVTSWTQNGRNAASEAQKRINALASMIATTKESLRRDVIADVTLDKIDAPLKVEFDQSTLDELFDVGYFGKKPVKEDDKYYRFFGADAMLTLVAKGNVALRGRRPSDPNKCEQAIVLPNAQPVTLMLTPRGSRFKANQKAVSKAFYASQFAQNRELCITAGFGENRTVALKLDKFGRTTEFDWTSDARAANITSALSGAAPDVASTYKTLHDWGLAKKKSELDELATEQSLRKARLCQATLDAGGTSCSD